MNKFEKKIQKLKERLSKLETKLDKGKCMKSSTHMLATFIPYLALCFVVAAFVKSIWLLIALDMTLYFSIRSVLLPFTKDYIVNKSRKLRKEIEDYEKIQNIEEPARAIHDLELANSMQDIKIDIIKTELEDSKKQIKHNKKLINILIERISAENQHNTTENNSVETVESSAELKEDVTEEGQINIV